MGACFDYRVYKKLYIKSKPYCPAHQKRGSTSFTKIEDGRRLCESNTCDWSERVVRSKLTQEQCENKWRSDVYESQSCDGNSYSGCIGMLNGDIKWISHSFETLQKAVTYIEDNHNKWDGPMGVRFDKAKGSSNRLTKQLGGFIIGGWCSS